MYINAVVLSTDYICAIDFTRGHTNSLFLDESVDGIINL